MKVGGINRCIVIMVLAIAAGTPVAIEAQEPNRTHPTPVSLRIRVAPESSVQQAGRFRARVRHCSRVKAALIGAAVGFGAGAVYGAIEGPSRYGILGTRRRTDAVLFGMIGAGGGALIGVAVCS